MRRRSQQEREALNGVAAHFVGTWSEREPAGDALLSIGRRKVRLKVISLKPRAPAEIAKPRLRFDRVVIRLSEGLREALAANVPDGITVLVTVTAPIRLASKTTSALTDTIRALLARRSMGRHHREVCYGNAVGIRFVQGVSHRAPKVVVFVHNPDSDPTLLLDLAGVVLSAGPADQASRPSANHWLILVSSENRRALRGYCAILARVPRVDFEKTIVVSVEGRLEEVIA